MNRTLPPARPTVARRLFTLALVGPLLCASAAVSAPAAFAARGGGTQDPAYEPFTGQTITSGSDPVTRIAVSPDLNCGAQTAAQPGKEQMFQATGCGTFAVLGSTTFGPHYAAGSTLLVPRTRWTPVSQTVETSGSTRTIVTVVTGGGAKVTQRDSYTAGDTFTTTTLTVENTTTASLPATVYRAADCSAGGLDFGTGALDGQGGWTCTGAPTSTAPTTARIAFQPATKGARGYVGPQKAMWQAIAAASPFASTPNPSYADVGAGLSWRVTIPAGVTATFSHRTAFGATPPAPTLADALPPAPTDPGTPDMTDPDGDSCRPPGKTGPPVRVNRTCRPSAPTRIARTSSCRSARPRPGPWCGRRTSRPCAASRMLSSRTTSTCTSMPGRPAS